MSMNLLERFIVWMTTKKPEPRSPLARLLAQARQAQYDERYEESITLLDEAETLASAGHDVTALVDITLSKADNLIYLKRYAEAETLIVALKQRTEAASHRAPLAYALCSLGTLAQAQGELAEARLLFERARQIAHSVRAVGAESRAAAHLADIALREGSASYALHLLREALPLLETSGDTELLPYFLLQMARACFIIGSTPEGERLLHTALEKSTAAGHRYYMRQSYLRLAEQAIAGGQWQKAGEHTTAALATFPADAQSGADFAAALCQMSQILLQQGELDAGTARAQQAVEIATRLDDAPLRYLAGLHLGIAHSQNEQYAAALPLLQAAAPPAAPPLPPALAQEVLHALARALAAPGDTAAAQAVYRQAIDTATRAGHMLPAARALVASGSLYERTRQLAEAQTQYQAALQHYEQAYEHGEVARLHCILGALREQMHQGKRALKDFEQALTRLSYLHDAATRGTVLARVAGAYADYGDMDSAESFFQEAITLAQQTGDRAAEAERRTHYGRFLTSIGDARPAIVALMEAAAFARPHHLTLLLALQADGLATAQRLLHDAHQAQLHHEEALSLLATLPEPAWRAACQVNQAHTWLLQGQPEPAAALFTAALATGRSDSYPALVVRGLAGLARIDLLQGQPDTALPRLTEAAALAQQSYSRRLQAEVKLLHSQYQALLGETAAAQTDWQEAEKLMKILRMPFSRPEWIASH